MKPTEVNITLRLNPSAKTLAACKQMPSDVYVRDDREAVIRALAAYFNVELK